MDKKSTISVITPVYNGLPYIKDCIESVLSQEFQDWEMIISDNGSTDGTLIYLDELKDSRIVIYKQSKNLGIFGNLNFLLKNVNTQIVKILCADDKLLPNALSKAFYFMKDRPMCAISRCLAEGESKKYNIDSVFELEANLPDYITPKASTLVFATFGNIIGNLSKATCNPKLISQSGGFNQKYEFSGDFEGWLRISQQFGIYLQNEELIFERIHTNQNSNLLNTKNELYWQHNTVLKIILTKIEATDILLIRRHWLIHHFAPRLSRAFKQILTGNYKIARLTWQDLPLNISFWECLKVYFFWKLNFININNTTNILSKRIKDLNNIT